MSIPHRALPCLAALALAFVSSQPLFAQASGDTRDALVLFLQGRDLESAGKRDEASARYQEAVKVCDQELSGEPGRMDSFVVKGWALFRLGRFREAVNVGEAALKVKFDARIVENLGESYYFLGDMVATLRNLQRYLDNSGEYAERVSTAYFYLGEAYSRQRRFEHADIAYAMATYREPNMARWWFRYGNAVEAAGDKVRALALYERALKLAPAMADAKAARDRLAAPPAATPSATSPAASTPSGTAAAAPPRP